MMGSLFRSIGSAILSLAVAMVLIVLVEVVSNALHPFPEGVDPNDMEACKAHVANYPTLLLAGGAAAWGGTTFVSAWLATRLGTGRHPAHGIVVGSLLFLAAIANMLKLPYATWFYVANAVLFPLGIYWGTRLGRGRTIASVT